MTENNSSIKSEYGLIAQQVTEVARIALKMIVKRGLLPWPDIYDGEFWKVAYYEDFTDVLKSKRTNHYSMSPKRAEVFLRETDEILSGVQETVSSFVSGTKSHMGTIDSSLERIVNLKDNSLVKNEIDQLIIHQEALKNQAEETEDTLERQTRIIADLYTRLRTDHLTGLNNRHALDADLAREIARADRYGNPLSVIMLDVDDFKNVNDTYGHVAGDKVLQKLAQILKSSIREIDSVYRYGGDEFVIILPHTSGTEGIALAERLKARIEKYVFTIPQEGKRFRITLSLGISEMSSGDTPKTLIMRADKALYEAKRSGKNQFVLLAPPND